MLFSTPMVQAELENRKTMTRRTTDLDSINERPDDWEFVRFEDNAKGGLNAVFKRKDSILHTSIPCRYGRPGDLLWVREKWQLKGWSFEDGMMTVRFATGETSQCFAPDPGEDSMWLLNKVEQLEKRGCIKPDPDNEEMFVFTDKKQPFYPSIHMPKDAARIWLQVTDVRVERLQDISEGDAKAEGLRVLSKDAGITWKYGIPDSDGYPGNDDHGWHWQEWETSPVKAFEKLWSKINGPDSYQANPFVWVVSFRVLSTTGKPDLNNL